MQLHPSHTRTTQMETLANSEGPDEMRHNATFYQRTSVLFVEGQTTLYVIITNNM